MKFKSKSLRRALVALLGLMSLYGMGACGGSGAVVTSDPNIIPPAMNPTPAPNSGPLPPKITQVIKNARNLGSLYPPDLDIPNVPGLSNYAFVTVFSPPAVVALNLNTNDLSVDGTKGLPSLSTVSGLGDVIGTVIADATHAYVLGYNKIVIFNPSNATIYGTLDFSDALTLSESLGVKHGNGSDAGTVSGSFTPFYPQGIAVSGNKLYVSFANLSFSFGSIDTAVQGVVRVYDIVGNTLVPSSTPYVAASGYNTTGLTVLPNGNLLVTSSGLGLYDSSTFIFAPTVAARLDLLNQQNLEMDNSIDLGLSYPNFRAWALSPDGTKAFMGSAFTGVVYEVALNPLQLLRGINNPIVITSADAGSDFLADVAMSSDGGGLYVASSNNSKVYAVDLTQSSPTLTNQVADFSAAPGLVGVGSLAFRPGQVGVDFTGPTLFVLTGNPGTVGAIFTY